MSSGISTTSYGGYDGLGRVLVSTQSTAGVDFTFGYTYKPIGLDTITYPSGRQVSNAYDAAGRIQQVSGLLAGLTTNFASAVNYAAHGELQSFQSGNGNFEEHCFDTGRLQTTGVRFGPVGRTGNCFTFGDLLNLRYGYGNSNDNNGNLRRQTITRPQGTQTQWYGYDALNRLTIAAENPSNPLNPICPDSAAAWCQQYGYDAFGNRWVPSSVKLPSTLETPNSASWYAPNNRIIGWGYDKGNLTRVGNLYTLGYDAENRQKTAAIGGLTATYEYDGDGRRVQKTVTMGGGSPVTTFFVYDASGELAAEYGLGTETGLHYVTQDALGSPRLRTNADGTVAQNYDYLPFGQEIGAGTANRDNTFSPGIYPAASSIGGSDLRFTGKERDAETGLDYFGARYFSAAQGRFTSPDEPFADQSAEDPQSWNLYSYGRNNPLRFVDPSGTCSKSADGNYTDGGSGLFPGPCSLGQIGNTPAAGKNPNQVTVRDQQEDEILALHKPEAPDPGILALQRGTQLAEPGVNIAAQGLILFGYIVAAPAMVAVECAAGAPSCTKGNVALAMLPELGALYEGGTILKLAAGTGKGAQIIQKAGGAAQAAKDFAALGGTEAINGGVRVRTLADGTRAVLYTASSTKEISIAIQQAGKTVTKVRY